MKQKLFTLLTLLLIGISGAWGAATATHSPGTYTKATAEGGYGLTLTSYNAGSGARDYEVYYFSWKNSKMYLAAGNSYATNTDAYCLISGVANNTTTGVDFSDNWGNVISGSLSGSNTSPAAEWAVASSSSSTHYVPLTNSSSITLKISGYDQFSFAGRDNHATTSGKQFTVTIDGSAQTFDHTATDWTVYRFDISTGEHTIVISGNGTDANRLRGFSLRIPDKTTPVLSLTSTSGSKDIAAGRTFNFSTLATLSSSPNVTAITDNITYSSSAEDVATIAADGTITLKKAGSTTITASFAGDEDYNEASVDYELTVTNSTNLSLDLTNGNLLTSDEISNKTAFSFGVTSAGARVEVGDASSVATLSGKYHSNEHGWNNFVATVAVTGPTKITFGTCNWGGDVTVKNSEDETVLTFNTNTGACYHNNTTANVISRFYEGGATTLTISGGNYVPYFAVEAVGDDQIEYPITFNITGAGATGTAPASVLVTKGSDFVIPANNSLYIAGKTLTGWTYAGTPYNVGESIENITSSITLTPNFEDNAFSLDELTAETTVNFYLNQGNGAPIMAASGGGSTMRVAQATVATQSIDVLMNVTSTTKFNNNQGAESAQITATAEVPTTIQVPGVAGMTVTMNYNFATSYLGESTNTGEYASSVTTWTYDGSDDPVTLTLIANGYPSLMTVTYPAKPTCETPTITPATFTADDQEVTMTSTEGATIYYTTDGSTPTTSSNVYDDGAKPTISSTTTFKAYAVKAGAFDSEVATVTVTRTASATWGSWDFTNWSSATLAGISEDDTNWSIYEKINNGTESSDLSGKVWTNKVAKTGTLVYGETTIPETEGLNFNIATHTLGITYNQGSTDLGTYQGSQYLWLYNSNSKIIIPSVPAGATIEIGVESHKIQEERTLTVTNTTEGSAKATTYTVETFTASATDDVQISPSKGMHIYYITVTANVETVPVTIAAGKEYTTLTSASNLDFTSVDGLKPYVVTADISDDKVTLSQRNKIAAGNGMVLKAETTGKTYNVPVFTGAGDDVTGNKMVGSATATTYVAENAGYILKSGVFQPSAGGDLPAGKAYLNIAVSGDAHALTISFEDEGETTGVVSVGKPQTAGSREVYNLNGQRVNASHKGIVIVNGKKYLNK